MSVKQYTKSFKTLDVIGDKANDIPVFKTFIYHNNFYLYDTYSNRLFRVNQEQYRQLKALYEMGINNYLKLNYRFKAYEDIVTLIYKGLLKANFISEIIHPETDYIEAIYERSVSEIILQITKCCNLQCRYCTFATNNLITRNHSSQKMTFDIARKSVDFLYEHSKDCKSLSISFYGGEPTIEFDLIKQIVNYAESKFYSKIIEYVITINGSILTDEIMDFFQEHNFKLAISFDGPKEIQDFHRKYRNTGNGTFDIVYNNILRFRNLYPNYFNEYVSFIAVVFEDEDYQQVEDFFQNIGITKSKIHKSNADLNGIDYAARHIKTFLFENLNVDDKSNTITTSSIVPIENDEFYLKQYNDKSFIPSKWHHNGPCVPTFKRLLVSTEGYFYMCEKFTEDTRMSIGDIWNGVNLQKAVEYLNIAKLSEKNCKSCWAMRFCKICPLYCIDVEEYKLSKNAKSISCKKIHEDVLNFLKKQIIDKKDK